MLSQLHIDDHRNEEYMIIRGVFVPIRPEKSDRVSNVNGGDKQHLPFQDLQVLQYEK
jgi:hypothetical protein